MSFTMEEIVEAMGNMSVLQVIALTIVWNSLIYS